MNTIQAHNSHGMYVATPSTLDEFCTTYFGHYGGGMLDLDYLRMFTASITGVDNWWNGESAVEMLTALIECGCSVESMSDYISRATNDTEFETKVHNFKVDVLGWLCAEMSCMAHHSDAILSDAYEMNMRFNVLRLDGEHIRNQINKHLGDLQDLYAQAERVHRKLATITGGHIPN